MHKEKRLKGFIEKSYKAIFLGIDTTTQSYICWIIELDKVEISSSVIFDELAVISTTLTEQKLEVC